MREKPLVLLVDDEMVFLEIASEKLKTHGFETVTTQSVEDAFMKAVSLMPDLVLSDIYMPPGPNGLEFALELRRNPATHAIKIAFFTSLRDPWMEVKDEKGKVKEELGDVSFFSKIDDVDVLGERVLDLIGLKK